MKDINIIIPIHKLDESTKELLKNAVNSVKENRNTYSNGELKIVYVISNDVDKNFIETLDDNYIILNNSGKTDFCSQINYAVDNINSEFFSILEYDDEYCNNWFKMANKYFYSNEDVSVFLPINIMYSENKTNWQYGNEMVLATSFSNEIGIIDFDCLEDCFVFNLTGGVFNTNDFKEIGKFKPSLKIASNYEFLLRLTNKKLKAMVVPKEGYKHMVAREGSITDNCNKTMTDSEIEKYFKLAKKEYEFVEDRNKKISTQDRKEILK